MFCRCGRGKTKNSRSTERHQNQWIQKLLWAVEKMSQRVYWIKWRVLWSWLKFKHLRINTQFFINKFWVVWGFPLICSTENTCEGLWGMHWDEEERNIFWSREQHMQRPRGRVHWKTGWSNIHRAVWEWKGGWASLGITLNFRSLS